MNFPFLLGRDLRNDMLILADEFIRGLVENEYLEYGLYNRKRPFGNPDIQSDILEMLDVMPPKKFGDYTQEERDYAQALYLALGSFIMQEWEAMRKNQY